MTAMAIGIAMATTVAWTSTSPAGAAPDNDDFANATLLSGVTGTVTATVVGATYEAGEHKVEGTYTAGSVWYRIVAPESGRLVVTNTGALSGPYRAAFSFAISTGASVDTQVYDGYDSMFEVCECTPDVWGNAFVDVTEGTTYYIAAQGGYPGFDSPWEVGLQWAFNPPSGDNVFYPSAAQVLSDTSGTITGSTARALADPIYQFSGGEPTPLFGSKDVWFRWTPPGPGVLTLHTAGSSFDTWLHIGRYHAQHHGSYVSAEATNDDWINKQSRVQLVVNTIVPDEEDDFVDNDYLIALSGPNQAGGNYRLTWKFTPSLTTTWHEIGDAGEVPAQAQNVAPPNPVTRIMGRLTGANDEDAYRICAPSKLSARATGSFDPQLFLFNLDGRGQAMNDDERAGSRPALLPKEIPFMVYDSAYILAISSWGNDPVNNKGAIFKNPKVGLIPADGPGASDPVLRWTNKGKGGSGTYSIELTGVIPCQS